MPDRLPGGLPVRKQIRLASFDYRAGGAYLVTIVTAGRRPLFGRIIDGVVDLTRAGDIAAEQWDEMCRTRSDHVTRDAFVIMPNHVHAILFIDAGDGPDDDDRVFGKPQARSVSTIIGGYKSAVSRLSGSGTAIWQRGFYEHIIRNENDLQRVRRYIEENPAKWDTDEHHV